MRRNCNLDLRLLSPAVSKFSVDDNPMTPMEIFKRGHSRLHGIIFDGMVGVCDATELQARAILLHASQGMENSNNPPTSPLLSSQQLCTSPGTSMKKSLQTFLLRRKHRVQTASAPY